MFLSLTNGFKLFDQNLSLTAGEPSKMSEMMALNIFNTFYGRTGWEGVGQAKAVLFFVLVLSLIHISYWKFEGEDGNYVFIIKTQQKNAVRQIKTLLEQAKNEEKCPVIASISKPYKRCV